MPGDQVGTSDTQPLQHLMVIEGIREASDRQLPICTGCAEMHTITLGVAELEKK